jgi:ZIP family zinc transporter
MPSVPSWLIAGGWGLLAGSALLIGAAVGFLAPVPRRLIATITAFGAGVLISALSFDLMDEAYRRGGFAAAAAGFLAGAVVYSLANLALARRGAKHRKRSGEQQPSEVQRPGSGLSMAIGALLDGVPESIVIGVTMLDGKGVNLVAVAAIFLSNVPEGMSSASGMKKAGRPAAYVFGIWGAIAAISSLAAIAGFTVVGQFGPTVISATTGVAAGAILAMLADTMMPEAFEEAHDLVGLSTVLGFLAAFLLTKLGA